MIELTRINIESYSHVIETRNKVYHLMCDLHMPNNHATRISSQISESLRQGILNKRSIPVVIGFTKSEDSYYVHIYVSKEAIKPSHNELFMPASEVYLKDSLPYLDYVYKVLDKTFCPDEDFLEEQNQKLIRQSRGEMLRVIKEKNKKLSKALRDIKNSSHLIQTEKMHALGSMTAGVAHELNNPMMGVLNFIQYCIKHTEKNDRRFEVLEDAEKEIIRCQEIITNLLTFSRMKAEGDEGKTVLKLSSLIKRILHLIKYKTRESNVKVELQVDKDEKEINAKVNNLQQVFLNLMHNAMHAMEKIKNKELQIRINNFGKNVVVYITDNGMGMSDETLVKIFDPFFTTKKAGEGTGLGLSVSRAIIEDHGGKLSCKSLEGEGSTFRVALPTAEYINREARDE